MHREENLMQQDETGQDSDEGQVTVAFLPFPFDEHRMDIQVQEKRRAREIRAAIRDDPKLESVSDFVCAQFAIVSLMEETDVKAVVDKIRHIQHLKRENSILDTYEHGKLIVYHALTDIAPGRHVAFGYDSVAQAYFHVSDMTKFDAGILSDPAKTRLWLAGEYYMNHAHYPDLEAVRRGHDVSVECQDYDWETPTMFNMTAYQKLVNEFLAFYPIHYRSLKLYHSGMFMNLLLSATKRLLPPMVRQTVEMGLGRDHGPLPEIFSMPTPEIAQKRLVQKVQQALRMRYHNETFFSLD